jgi:hypothetical protein
MSFVETLRVQQRKPRVVVARPVGGSDSPDVGPKRVRISPGPVLERSDHRKRQRHQEKRRSSKSWPAQPGYTRLNTLRFENARFKEAMSDKIPQTRNRKIKVMIEDEILFLRDLDETAKAERISATILATLPCQPVCDRPAALREPGQLQRRATGTAVTSP